MKSNLSEVSGIVLEIMLRVLVSRIGEFCDPQSFQHGNIQINDSGGMKCSKRDGT